MIFFNATTTMVNIWYSVTKLIGTLVLGIYKRLANKNPLPHTPRRSWGEGLNYTCIALVRKEMHGEKLRPRVMRSRPRSFIQIEIVSIHS